MEAEKKAFIVYIATLKIQKVDIYLIRKAQIAFLFAKETQVKILYKYVNYIDVFLLEVTIKLLEQTGINNHPINLEDDK